MNILGISFGHSAAAALIRDGKVLGAVEEEKLTRIKGHTTFPLNALEYLYQTFHFLPSEVDYVAVGCTDLSEFSYGFRTLNKFFGRSDLVSRIIGVVGDGLKRILPFLDITPYLVRYFYRCLKDIGFSREKVKLVDHHASHAASAYYTSPWTECAIITNDGKGDGLCGSFSVVKDGKITRYNAISHLHSIGQFYQSVTKFLGFKVNRHEGKITGLAAFGNASRAFPLMNKIFTFSDGVLRCKFHDIRELCDDPLKYFSQSVSRKDFITDTYIRSLHGQLRNFAAAYQLYINFLADQIGGLAPKDVAAGIQQLAEEAVVAYVKAQLENHPRPYLCLAGGVFANVKINQRLREIPGIKNIYIQPAMDDSGTALGAALQTWVNLGNLDRSGVGTVYLGPEYSEAQIEYALRKYKLPYRKVDQYEETLGKMIFEGKIVGRFNGALEWGPRALGNRSIIARPTDKTINDTLNQRLRRTEFMPFAPSMLDEDAPEFLLDYSPDHLAAKYMTATYNVRPSKIEQIQAAVHVDGTARPQVVFREDNVSFYEIIKAYKKYSGFGVVINTSFNMHEEPIVNSPEDAIRAFLSGAVDVLSLGPFLIEKS